MASLGNLFNNLQTMGLVFWVGAGAMALGATILVVSLATMMRRIKISRPTMTNPIKNMRLSKTKTSSAHSISVPTATARKTDSGYEPSTFPLQNREIPAVASTSISFELTDRLHRAANTLEEIIDVLHKENHSRGFSPLKDEAESVEYLFKTTVS